MVEVNSGDNYEYDNLKKFKIFDSKKLGEFIKKREYFQNRLSSDDRRLEDFGEYIIFEKKVHTIVINAHMEHGDSISGLIASLTKRILRLYRATLRSYGEEYLLWLAYVTFCKKYQPQDVPVIYEKMLEIHCKEKTWCDFAIWTHQHRMDLTAAEHIISCALNRYPDSEMIYVAQFRILLAETAKKNSRNTLRNTVCDQSEGLKRVLDWYLKCKRNFHSYRFLFDLLLQCEQEQFSVFTPGLQKMIIDDVRDMFPCEEAVYDALAQRELRGFSECDISHLMEEDVIRGSAVAPAPAVNDNTELSSVSELSSLKTKNRAVNMVNEGGIWRKRSLKRRIKLCCNAYEHFVRTVNTPEMLRLYIDAMLKLYEDLSKESELKWKSLVCAFKMGHKTRMMNCDHYCVLFNLLVHNSKMPNNGFAEKILSELPDQMQNAQKVYQLWFSFYIKSKNEDKIYGIFRMATRKLPSLQALPIWEFVIVHYQTHYEDNTRRLQSIYKDACRHECSEYLKFRTQYLDWCLCHLSIEQTRREYDDMIELFPPSLDLHRKMAQIEGYTQLRPNIHRWRFCHDNAIRFFGKTDAEVWNDYIRFETDYGDSSRIPNLYNKMARTLST